MKQRSEEWFEIRKEKMTASHAQAIAANGKGLVTYIREKMCSLYSASDDVNYTNSSMKNGVEQESVAKMLYEFETGNKVVDIGFVVYDDYVGCSPDGYVKDGLIEIKCPTNKVYFDLLLDKKIDSKYEWQMQMQMLVCDKLWCDYVVYNPNFKQQLFIKRVFKDEEKIKKLMIGFESGIKMMKEIKKELENE